MAAGDYRSCDVCGGKAFYDARLNYEDASDRTNAVPFRQAGVEQYDDPALLAKYGTSLDYVGDWAVICTDCSKTHRTVILPIETAGRTLLASRLGVRGSCLIAI